MPAARPRTCRLAGVVFAPMNAVMSAKAGVAINPQTRVTSAVARTWVMNALLPA